MRLLEKYIQFKYRNLAYTLLSIYKYTLFSNLVYKWAYYIEHVKILGYIYIYIYIYI